MKKKYYSYILLFFFTFVSSLTLQAQCRITWVADLASPTGTGLNYRHVFRLKNSSSTTCNAVGYRITGFAGYKKVGSVWQSCRLNADFSSTGTFSVNRNNTVDYAVNFSVNPECGDGEYKIEFSILDVNGNAIGDVLSGGRLYTTFNFICGPPTNLSVNMLSSNSATVSWQSGSTTSYVIRHRVVGTSSWSSTGFRTGNNYTFTNLIPNTNYEWQVNTACNDFSGSSYVGSTFRTQPLPCNIQISATPTNATCGQSNGSINVNGFGANSYHYKLDNGSWQTSSTFSGLSAGNYTVYIRDANNVSCERSTNVTITNTSSAPQITTHPEDATICNGSSTTLRVIATGTGLTYQWKKDGQNVGSSSSYTATTAGYYTCVVSSSSCGQVESNGVTVTVNTRPAQPTITPPSGTIEVGQSILFEADAAPNVTYAWTFQNGTPSTSTDANPSVQFTSAGTKTVSLTVSDNNNCGASPVRTLNVTVVETCPDISITTEPVGGDICQGRNKVLSVVATGGTLRHQWKKDGTNIPNAIQASYTATQAGDYTCEISNTCGAIPIESAVAIIVVNSAPNRPVITPPSGTIEVGQPVSLASDADPAATSTWTFQNGTPSTSTESQPQVTFSSAGTKRVTLVINNTCGDSPQAIADIQVNETCPTIAITTEPIGGEICQGAQKILSVAATNGNIFQWKKNGTNVAGATQSSYTAREEGDYTCLVTSSCDLVGIESNTATITFVNMNIVVEPTNAQCQLINGQITVVEPIGTGYSYSIDGGMNYQNSPEFIALQPRSYTVKVKNAAGCTQDSDPQEIVNEGRTPIVAFSSTVNGLSAQLRNNSLNGTSWLWDLGNNTTSTQENPSITYAAPGNYNVRLTATNGNCSSYLVQNVLICTLTATAQATNHTSCGLNNNGSAQVTLQGGSAPFDYSWSNGVMSTPSVSGLAAGTYSVLVLDHHSCIAAAEVTINPSNAPIPSFTTQINDLSVQFLNTSTNVLACTWNFGNGQISNELNPTISYATAGTYSVNLRITTSCGVYDTTTQITVVNSSTCNLQARISTNRANATICEGDSITLRATGGTNFLWSNGAITDSITVNNAGTYSVTVTEGNCSDTASQVVTVNALPNITISGDTSFCHGSSTTITAQGASSYLWSNNVTTPSVRLTDEGIYSVQGTATNGCTSILEFEVTAIPLPNVDIVSSRENGQATLEAIADNCNFVWSNGVQRPIIIVPVGPVYYVTATDTITGCTNIDSISTAVLYTLKANNVSCGSGNTDTVFFELRMNRRRLSIDAFSFIAQYDTATFIAIPSRIVKGSALPTSAGVNTVLRNDSISIYVDLGVGSIEGDSNTLVLRIPFLFRVPPTATTRTALNWTVLEERIWSNDTDSDQTIISVEGTNIAEIVLLKPNGQPFKRPIGKNSTVKPTTSCTATPSVSRSFDSNTGIYRMRIDSFGYAVQLRSQPTAQVPLGIIDANDIYLLRQIQQGNIPLTSHNLMLGDVNGDGAITLLDVTILRRRAIGMYANFSAYGRLFDDWIYSNTNGTRIENCFEIQNNANECDTTRVRIYVRHVGDLDSSSFSLPIFEARAIETVSAKTQARVYLDTCNARKIGNEWRIPVRSTDTMRSLDFHFLNSNLFVNTVRVEPGKARVESNVIGQSVYTVSYSDSPLGIASRDTLFFLYYQAEQLRWADYGTIYAVLNTETVRAAYSAGNCNTQTGIRNYDIKKEVEIYPNPTSGVLTVNIQNLSLENTELSIFNQLGQMVFYQKVENAHTDFDVSNLSDGVYMLKVQSKNENDIGVMTTKLVINK